MEVDETDVQIMVTNSNASNVDLDKNGAVIITPPLSKLNLTQDLEKRDTKKVNLLTVINKIQPTTRPLAPSKGSAINLSTGTTNTPIINLDSSNEKPVTVPNKRKSSPPVYVSKEYVVPPGLVQRQTIASATVPSKKTLKQEPIVIDDDDDDVPSTGNNVEERPLNLSSSNENVPPLRKNNKEEQPPTDEQTAAYSDNVMSHMLDFLYKGLMARGETDGYFPNPKGSSDRPSLEMPEQKSHSKSDVEMLLKYMNIGTESIKDLFRSEVNLIYECKRCKGLFRSVPNLVRHKKQYCKRSGIMSNLLQQPNNKSLEEDNMMKNLINILNPQDNPGNIPLDFEQIPANKNAVYQRRGSDKVGSSSNSFKQNVTMTAKTASDRRNFTAYNPQVNRSTSQQQYIILNQPGSKNQIARGSIKPVQSTGRSSLPANIMITSNGKIGTLGGVVVDATAAASAKSSLNKSFTAIKSKESDSIMNDHGSAKTNGELNLNEFKKKPKCPLCQKEMAERKNVKRHLIHVHMMTTDETWKLMNSTMPLPASATSSPVASNNNKKTSSFATPTKYCEEMDKLSVEVIQIGPDRKIKVLPKTYMFPDSYCPLCSKTMSSRNNVRRHMLETHDYLIFGDKKYYQIKLLLARDDTCSQIMDGKNRSMRRFYGASSNLDIEQIKVELEMYEAMKRPKMPEKLDISTAVSTTTITVSDEGDTSLSLVKPATGSVKLSPKTPKVAASKMDGKYSGSETEKTPEKQINKAEAKKMIDAANCKCLSCNEEFARRQTLKNHMLQTHLWSKDLFNSVYDDAYAKKSDDENDSDDDESSEDDKENHSIKQTTEKPKNEENTDTSEKSVALSIPVNKNLTNNIAGGKVVKTVLLQKVVSATPASSSSTLTDANKLKSASTSNVLATGGIYVMKTNVQIVPSGQSKQNSVTVQNTQENHTEILNNMKRKLSSEENSEEPVLKKERLFDIKSNTCCLCKKEFGNTSILKRHMIEIHSCTMEQVLGASRDTAMVDPKVQKMGENLGYDIENAKCLLCSKYFFVRPALKKHLNKVHSYNYATLQGLDSEDEVDGESDSEPKSPDKKTYGLQLRNVVKREVTDENGEGDGSNQSDVLLSTVADKFSKESLVEKIVTDKAAQDALKILPSSMINAGQLKCVRCKQKFSKLWDLKEHILHHIGMGVYACKFCEEKEVKCAYNLELIMSHIQNDHPAVTRRSATTSMKSAKINNKAIWKAYGLPLRR